MRMLKTSLRFAWLMLSVLSCAQQTCAGSAAAALTGLCKTVIRPENSMGRCSLPVKARLFTRGGSGWRLGEWSIPDDLQTKLEIGSMTKQFTAMLILQFVNDGRVRLDGHVSEYLPYYRLDTGKRITISELLSHTSGVPNFTDIPGFLDGPASRVRYGVREFVQKYCGGDLQFEPGTKFEYSNSGCTHSETLMQHRAAGYERSPAGGQNPRYYDMSIPFAAGAPYSTAQDLFLWDQALYGERLLPAMLRDLLFKPSLENYGYGWVMLIPETGSPYAGESIPMHGGAIFGFQSEIQRIIRYKELIILLDNTDSPKLLDIALPWRSGRVLSESH